MSLPVLRLPSDTWLICAPKKRSCSTTSDRNGEDAYRLRPKNRPGLEYAGKEDGLVHHRGVIAHSDEGLPRRTLMDILVQLVHSFGLESVEDLAVDPREGDHGRNHHLLCVTGWGSTRSNQQLGGESASAVASY